MGAKVTFKIVTSIVNPGEKTSDNESQFKPAYSEGQIIFVESEQKIYLDFHNHRLCYSADTNGVNYVGISKSDPTLSLDGVLTLSDNTELHPRPNDMVVYGKKEYLYRKNEKTGKEGWHEIGDEDAPSWEDEP